MLKLWMMQSTPSLPLLPGLLSPGVVAPDRILSMGQIELFKISKIAKIFKIVTFKDKYKKNQKRILIMSHRVINCQIELFKILKIANMLN